MASTKISTASNPSAITSSPFAARSAVASSTGETRTVNRLPYLFVAVSLLALIALGISGYLSYVAFTSSKVAGCGGGVFDCEHVLHSKWSTMLGLPVGAWAATLYLSVISALLFSARSAMSAVATPLRTWTWTIVTGAAVSAGLAAIWFTGLQIFVLKHFCPWCLGAHACGLVLCISTLSLAPISVRLKAGAAMIGALGTLGLVVVQLLTPEPLKYTIEEFPSAAPSAAGAVIDDAEMFDAPGEGDDILLAPDAEPSAALTAPAGESFAQQRSRALPLFEIESTLSLLFQPSRLLLAQVAAPTGSQVAGDKAAGEKASSDAGKTDAGKADAGKADAAAAKEQKPEERTISLSGANVKLRPNQWPIIGSPDAKYVVVELFDYTCRHCRATQQAIRGAKATLKNDFAVICLPVPLNRSCNETVTADHPSHRESCEISKLALALWRVDPSKFAEFHEWVMSTEPIPTLAVAKAKAVQLVDAKALETELAQPNAAKFISKHVDIYRRLGAGPVPKLVFSNTVLTGELTNAQVLVDTLRRQPQ